MIKEKITVLFSNGLDSRLVIKLLLKNNYHPIALYFDLPFGSRYPEKNKAEEFLKKEKVEYKIINCKKGKLLEEYFNTIKKPKYSRGKGLNPCIDCKIFMLKKAKEFSDKNKIKFIATGEVLGERPLSQTLKAFKILEKESDLENRIIRPLSEKLIKKEKKDIPEKLKMDIQGRRRIKQLELAKKLNIDFPTPAGGCLLCEPGFCKKVKPFLKKEISPAKLELMKLGRHFLEGNIILGKNQKENETIEKVHKKYKIGKILVPEKPGPTAFITKQIFQKQAKELINKYSKKNPNKTQ